MKLNRVFLKTKKGSSFFKMDILFLSILKNPNTFFVFKKRENSVLPDNAVNTEKIILVWLHNLFKENFAINAD